MAIVSISLLALVGFLAWVIFSTIRRYQVAKLQASLQANLFNRIDSTETLISYISSEAGRASLEALALDSGNRAAPYQNILLAVQTSIVLLALGASLLILHHMSLLRDDSAVIMGVIPIALGIGAAVAAFVTYTLSRKFGLIK